MKPSLITKRHPLLLYRRTVDRRWRMTLLIGALLLVLWGCNFFVDQPYATVEKSIWLLIAAVLAILYSVFTFISRYLAHVRVGKDHLRLATPFFQVRISYRRFIRIYPKDMHSLFPPQSIKSAQYNFLEPFYGHTAVVIELTEYPIARLIMQIFFAREMLLRGTTGVVILVPDWMAFSTTLDSHWGSWQHAQAPQRKLPGSYR